MKTKIGGIIQIANLARISLACSPGQASIAGRLFDSLGREQINIQFITQSRDGSGSDLLVFCVDQGDQKQIEHILASFQSRREIHSCTVDPAVTCLGVYGPDFRIRPSLAGRLLGALQASEIDIQAVSTSLSTFSVVIPSNQVDRALGIIHQEFELP